MTEGVIETKGTRIAFGYRGPASSDPTLQIMLLACPTAVDNLTSGPRPRVDITCLSSLKRQYGSGLADPPQLTFPVNFIPRSESHQAMIDAKKRGSTLVMPFMVLFGDQPDDPTTVNSDGLLVSPGPTSVGFMAYVDDFSISAAVGDFWKGTITIQLAGDQEDLEWDLPEADLP